MKTKTILLSIIMLTAIVLTACGGRETETVVPSTSLPSTAESTATEMPSGTETTTGDLTTTPGIPVTGGENAARLSNELDFHVMTKDGEDVGEVKDMVIDVDNAKITYVIVGAGGLLNIGEKDIVVPWNKLKLQSGAGTTGGQQNAFILQTDKDTFSNFPDMDWKSNFPKLGQPAADWDVNIRNYWENGTTPGGTTGTVVPDTTTTPTMEGTAVPAATATNTTSQGQAQNPGLGLGQKLQGVMLATDVLGSTVNLMGTTAPGQSGSGSQPQGQATATSSGGTTAEATATPGSSTSVEATATLGTSGTGQTDTSNLTFTIQDMIIDTNNGKVLYIVVSSNFSDGERWIPVPLALLEWNGTDQTFGLNTDGNMLSNAPFFTEDQFPDVTSKNWDSEFSNFWKTGKGNGGGTSTGSATATPTP